MSGYEIDARMPESPLFPALQGMGGTSPRGDTIAFTNAFMTWNGAPWIGVAGEIHYARLSRHIWRNELRKMKAGGVDIVSTYVFWIHHEEEEGRFDWEGDRDLRGFIAACAEEGLTVIVRVGPFCHGEVRNGGMPDWLYGRPFPLRSNDERYLGFVRILYDEIGRQLAGLFFQEGGPVIGIQLENEFMHAGAPWETVPRLSQEWVPGGSGGAEHLRKLKEIALAAGLKAPLYTSTAWGGAPIPEGEVLPLYGGYAFCPWNVTESTPIHAPTGEYVFRNYRVPSRRDTQFDPPYDPLSLPFACCEMGGGMQAWYRYRFVVPAQSVEAMAVIKLAGGCSLLGYYMYHGGTNPVGLHSFLNEHIVPRLSYDFQAPLGEFGAVHESYGRLRRIHLFCKHFGASLAGMTPVLPDGAETISPRDTTSLRYAVRVRGDSGFLFLNNYQDHVQTRDIDDLSVNVRTASSMVQIPAYGTLTLRSGESAILPFNMDIEGIRLVCSTAQPMARVETADAVHLFFFEHDGMTVTYLFGDGALLAPGAPSAFARANPQGRRVVFHTLSERESLGFAIMRFAGRDRAVMTDAEAFVGDDALFLRRRSTEYPLVDVWMLPGIDTPLHVDGRLMKATREGDFTRVSIPMEKKEIPLVIRRWASGDAEVTLPQHAFDGVQEIILCIRYDGDVGSALIDGRLVADNFANGAVWEIGLERLRPGIESRPLSIHITPRREGTVVMRESGMAAQPVLDGRAIGEITSLTAVAVREVAVRAETNP